MAFKKIFWEKNMMIKRIFTTIVCILVCFVICACGSGKENYDNENEADKNLQHADTKPVDIYAERQLVFDVCTDYYTAIYYENGNENNDHILKYVLPDTNKYQQMTQFDKANEFETVFLESFEYADYIEDNSIKNLVSIASSATKFEVSEIIVKGNTAKADINIMYVNPIAIMNLDNDQTISEYLLTQGTDYDTYSAKIDSMNKQEYEKEKEKFYRNYGQFLMKKATERVKEGELSKKTVTENLIKIDEKWYIT